ncbi:Hpt domain-containing protein [Paucibacter soli]|uniref:Hpt domain-containing protein n=1 Tax=Paucibacter soli TaxID=3133433 RepID=UPI0030A91B88
MSRDFASILAVLQAGFIDELPERCAQLESQVLALERGEASAFDELYRQVHSLKGSGGMFGVTVISTICHQFETFLSLAHADFRQAESGIALRYVDLLRRTIAPEGRDSVGVAGIEQVLEQLRARNMGGRFSVLAVEGSAAMRRLYQQIFASRPSVHLVVLDTGVSALERLLHEPFDLLVASRELPDLNALALTAAVRESGRCNKDVPVIVVTSSPKPIPAYLKIRARIRRDPKLAMQLMNHVNALKGEIGT